MWLQVRLAKHTREIQNNLVRRVWHNKTKQRKPNLELGGEGAECAYEWPILQHFLYRFLALCAMISLHVHREVGFVQTFVITQLTI